jgi:hypothetical protein
MMSLEHSGGLGVMGSAKRFKQHPQAICTELDGEIALFQSSTCDYLVLNDSGSAIWNALTTQPTLAELCEGLHEEYNVSPDDCLADVEAWLEIGVEMQVVIAFESD